MVEVDSGVVLPLGSLNADPTCRHLGDHDTAAHGYNHFYVDPDLEIPACLGIGLPPLCGEVAGQALHNYLRLCAQHAVDRDKKHGKLALLLQKLVKVLAILVTFCHLQALIRVLLYVRSCVCVNHLHIQDAVRPPIVKISDQKVALLFRVYHCPWWVFWWV